MKRLAVFALLGALCVSLFTGCGAKEETPVTPQVEPISVVEVEDIVDEEPVEEKEVGPEGMLRSDLTGEWIAEEIAEQRPFAVMMGNTKVATPQYGIGQADVIYEAPVEGSETRLMSIFQDYQSVDKIMSIRSCRLYYIDWALEFDAVYGHYGQAYLAEDMLAQSYVNNLSGLDGGVESVMYHRDNSRKAPHNAYTNGEGITAGIEFKGYEKMHKQDYQTHYNFNKDESSEVQLADGVDAVVVKPGYKVNKPWFVYDSENGVYKRYQNGKAQVDGSNDQQIRVKNILIQEVEWNVADENCGYLAIKTTGTGKGYYITNGKAIPVTWSKDGQTAPTKYFDANGDEITMNRGKTWVCITQDTYAEDITFYASEDEFTAPE